MRYAMLTLGFFTAAALACGNPSYGCGGGCAKGGGASLIETVSFALEEMGLEDNSDIRTAMHLYQKEMRSMRPEIPDEAFSDGHFYPAVYAQKAMPSRAMEAQIDLFETIYMLLDEKQKQEFPLLMKMYQHHMQFAARGGRYGMCDGTGPRYDNRCGSPECPPVPRKRMAPSKR